MALIEFQNVTKQYFTGVHILNALDNVSFSIEKGEFIVILGPSGAGKSTLLNLLGGMESATKGAILVDGKVITDMNAGTLTKYRATDVGFVFQFYNLVQNLTAIENVELAAQICKNPMDAAEVIDLVGLHDRAQNFPAQLSGGEQQRVAIARALAKNPKLLLCDEPTGALDYNTGKAVLQLLQDCSRKNGMTVVIITHNQALTAMADRVVSVKSGVVIDVRRNEYPIPIENIEW